MVSIRAAQNALPVSFFTALICSWAASSAFCLTWSTIELVILERLVELDESVDFGLSLFEVGI